MAALRSTDVVSPRLHTRFARAISSRFAKEAVRARFLQALPSRRIAAQFLSGLQQISTSSRPKSWESRRSQRVVSITRRCLSSTADSGILPPLFAPRYYFTQFYLLEATIYMSDYHIALPSKPRVVSESERSGTYEIDGLYPGYGYTLGNSLRRIIHSSLPGAAVTHVKIPGVAHEFSTIEGVKEDVVTILLNIRKIRFKLLSDEPQTITLSIKGPQEVTAANLKLPGQVEVLNPEQHIADVTGKINFEIELRTERGLGYIPKEEHQKERVEIGTIALDAIFSPIRRANYEVENMRVGDRTDFNRLRLLIETDGTLGPREALELAIETMIHQLKAIVGFKEEDMEEISLKKGEPSLPGREEKATALDAEVLKTRITELDLPQRVEDALDNASIRTVGGLVRKREDDLLSIEGLGQKGLQDIKRAL